VTALSITPTPIEGLLVIDLPVHADARGWFKENWHREKMASLGLPDLRFVQNNMSFNDAVGTTRGIHAEPWEKYISVASGRVFGAWVDLRHGSGFGTTFSIEIGPERAIFVPRGVGNAYQTLEPDTAYTYLVNEHWIATARYTFLNLADETAGIPWPIPLKQAVVSQKDLDHPRLAEIAPVSPRRTLVLGANGQVGQALAHRLDDPILVGRSDFDIADPASYERFDWSGVDTIVNAAAYTKVDAAETDSGRERAWAVNVAAVGLMARVAHERDLTLVHVSSDYVFDGRLELYDENAPFAPLGVYGQTKAAGDAIVSTVPRHYILRSSWVIGDGPNFVRTMSSLADGGGSPQVVNDQWGRLTFTDDLAAGIRHLLDARAPYGTYNLTNRGPVTTWAAVARRVFELRGASEDRVQPVSTVEYFAHKAGMAPRPAHSALDLTKLEAVGFQPRDADQALREYLA
jgi:dTDP-4-dehydrorhamnose reductase